MGPFRTSPVEILYVEANEPSLEERRIKLTLQYITKLKANPSNPAYNCVFHLEYKQLYESKPRAIPPLGIRIQQHVDDSDVNLQPIAKHSLLSLPPWQSVETNVDLSLTRFKKSKTNELTFQQAFNELRDQYPDHRAIYTDGSKDGRTVAAAAVTPSKTLASRLHDGSSICTAEAKAILLSLQHIIKSTHTQYIIFSDSLSCLQAIKNCKTDHPIIRDILTLLNQHHDNYIIFCWLPSHMGIRGNSKADAAAKSALESDHISSTKIPYTDSKPDIKSYIKHRWQSHWDEQDNNKLHSITPHLGYFPLSSFSRREAVVLRRCRIGHSHFTHSYLLKGEDPPECIACQCPLTIKHILLECGDTRLVRDDFYSSTSMQDLFSRVGGQQVLAFLKAVCLFDKI